MGKDPAVLWYTSDFLTGTTFFTDEQVGQYTKLLCHQHQLGHLPFNHMIFICKSKDSPVFKKFTQDDEGNYYNERMEREIESRISYCNSRSHRGISGRKPKKKVNHMKTVRKSYGNRIKDEDDNRDGVKDKGKNKTIIPDNLNQRVFLECWDGWKQHRKEIRKPLTPESIKQQLNKLSRIGPNRAVNAIAHSISNGYQGIFEQNLPKGALGHQQSPPKQVNPFQAAPDLTVEERKKAIAAVKAFNDKLKAGTAQDRTGKP